MSGLYKQFDYFLRNEIFIKAMRGRQSKENLSISKVNTSSHTSSYKP